MGCITGLAKLYLFFFNLLFFLLGLTSLVLGIWVTVSKSDFFRLINKLDVKFAQNANKADIDAVAQLNGTVALGGYILIGLGIFTLLMGFFGCLGAIIGSKCLLATYAAIISLMLIVEIAVAIMFVFFQNHVRTTVVAGIKKLQNKFFISMKDYELVKNESSIKAIGTFFINHMQMALECCGIETVGDIASSPSWRASDRSYDNRLLAVPLTCCHVAWCRKGKVQRPSYNWSNLNEDLAEPDCMFKKVALNTGLNNKTCYDGLMAYLRKQVAPLIATCIAIMQMQLLGIVLACCIIIAAKKDVSKVQEVSEQQKQERPLEGGAGAGAEEIIPDHDYSN